MGTRAINWTSDIQDVDNINISFQYIEKNYQKKIELSNVARELAFSETYTCRFIKQITTKSLTQLVNEFRIAKACELLVNTDLSVSEVYSAAGFNNLSNFNRQFKAVTKNSPRDYRKGFRSR
ncbi:MAG: AraC family transcriptional regulator [Bacteroidota bacterium]